MVRGHELSARWYAFHLAMWLLAFQAGCATAGLQSRHPSFTADRVLALKIGMTTDEVVAVFGRPDRTRVMTCGSQTPSPWQCLIWEYDMGPHPRGRYQSISNTNRLTFSVDGNAPRLNNWDIDLMYDSQPS